MEERQPKEPHAECGATTRKGTKCSKPAGWRTDHPGQGRCYLHGGATPIKHGRYSTIKRPRLKTLLDRYGRDDDPLDLRPELDLLRALVTDYVERYDAFTEALIAWHESYLSGEGTPKPRQVIDILAVGQFLTQIGTLTDRIWKRKTEGTITLATLDRVLEQLGAELVNASQEVIRDAAQRAALLAAVERRWNTIRVDAGERGSPRPPLDAGPPN